jgi:hypothetical protein
MDGGKQCRASVINIYQLALAGKGPIRTNRTRSNRQPLASVFAGSVCSHRKTGKRPWASAQMIRYRSAGR